MIAKIGDWKTWTALLLLAGMTCRGSAQTKSESEPIAAMKAIIGDYSIVEGRMGKEQILPERLADVTVKITEKTITTYDGDKKERYSASYKLDVSQSPWRIQMTSIEVAVPAGQQSGQPATSSDNKQPPTTTTGLIQFNKDASEGKLIYALPGGAAPKSFEPEDRQQRFVLKRLKSTTQAAAEAERAKDAPKSDKTER